VTTVMFPISLIHVIGHGSLEKVETFVSTNNLSPEVNLNGSHPSVDVVYISLPTYYILNGFLGHPQKRNESFLRSLDLVCIRN
jgi:hypothetical protein